MASERKFIDENVRRLLLKEFLKNQVSRAGFGGLDIQRTPLGTRVKLIIERPGLVIGKRGGAIRDLTTALENEFNFDHPQIEVEEVKNPSLNAQIMAYKLAESLERGWHFRRAGHSTVRRIMESGAVGCQVVISGKLTGQRHRVEKFKQGHIKFCGEPRNMWVEEGFAVATVKLGVIGVKVQITHPDTKLPDEVNVYDSIPEEKEEPAEEPKEAEEEKPKKETKAKKSRSTKKKAEKKDDGDKNGKEDKAETDKKVKAPKKEKAAEKTGDAGEKEEPAQEEKKAIKPAADGKKEAAKAPAETKEDKPVEVKEPVPEEKPEVEKALEKPDAPAIEEKKDEKVNGGDADADAEKQ